MSDLPEIPLQDVGLGLASAVLLFLAAYYLVRSRLDPPMDEQARLLRSSFPHLFAEVGPHRTAHRLSFIASLFLHLIGFALAPLMQLFFPGPLPFNSPRYRTITLEYHIPLPPLVAPDDFEELTRAVPESDPKEHPDGDSTDPKRASNDSAGPASPTRDDGLEAPQIRAEEPAPVVAASREGPAESPPAASEEHSADEGGLQEEPEEQADETEPRVAEAADDETGQDIEEPQVEVEAEVAQSSNEQLEQLAQAAVQESFEREIALSPPEVIKLLLPDVVQTNPALKDIVLQPDFTLRLPDDYVLDVPPVLLWSTTPPKLEDTAILRPGPGDEEPARLRLPDVQPQLQPPNDVPALADLQIPDAPSVVGDPILPITPADVIPLAGRLLEDTLPEPPSFTGGQGEDSLLVFSQNPDISSIIFALQPALRLGSIDTEPGDMPTGVVGGTGSADASGTEPETLSQLEGAPEKPAGGSGDGEIAAGPASGSREGRDGEGKPKTIQIFRGHKGTGPGSVQIVKLGGSGYSQNVIKIGSRPMGARASLSVDRGGAPGSEGQPDGSESGRGRLRPLPRARYGIILVSNARSALPEAAGVLSGNPIYTVYLNVPKAPRKWVLQYCQPASATQAPRVAGAVVRVRPGSRLDPPFPIQQEPIDLTSQVVPSGSEDPRRVVAYATFDAEGKLGNLRMIKGAAPEIDRTILSSLLSWEFLPAFEEGNAVPVEVLFGIPLR